jgi:hypothetical protein
MQWETWRQSAFSEELGGREWEACLHAEGSYAAGRIQWVARLLAEKKPVNWAACNRHLCTRQHAVRGLVKRAAGNEEPAAGCMHWRAWQQAACSHDVPRSGQYAVRSQASDSIQWEVWQQSACSEELRSRQHVVRSSAACSYKLGKMQWGVRQHLVRSLEACSKQHVVRSQTASNKEPGRRLHATGSCASGSTQWEARHAAYSKKQDCKQHVVGAWQRARGSQVARSEEIVSMQFGLRQQTKWKAGSMQWEAKHQAACRE